jgi:hypothetical protein
MVAVCSRHCPCCLGPAKAIRTDLTSNGTRRRRISCLSRTCGYRWTEWDGPRPPAGGARTGRRGKRAQEVDLGDVPPATDPATGNCTPEAVHFLLTRRDIPSRQAARALGISYTAVRNIRTGARHADVHPELPRWQPRQPLCTEDKVRFLLTRTDLPNAAAGRAVGLSREMARLVRLGAHCGHLCPELPRRASAPALTCVQCEFWSGGLCGMGLPDPAEEGPGFAADCALFSPAASADQ